jgi:hypothetical protein
MDIRKQFESYSKEDKRLNELDELYWTDLDDIQKLAYSFYLKK